MSHSALPGRSSGPSADEEAETRELEEYFSRQSPVDVAAADWHTRVEQGLAASEDAELRQWLRSDPAHAVAFERLDRGMALLRSLSVGKESRARALPASSSVRTARPARFDKFPWWAWLQPRPAAAALCCALILAVGVGWHQWQLWPTFTHEYVSERGQRLDANLPDGTRLAVDADTRVQVALYRDRREVRMTEGQVMFTVASDRERPFHVLAGAVRITVIGTRFSVRYRNSGAGAGIVDVAVEEGRVRVIGTPTTDKKLDLAPIVLVEGQSVSVSPDGQVGPIVAVSPGHIAPWRKGLVFFENMPLAEALLELERYGPTGLIVRDPVVAAMPIGGSYRTGYPDDFARVLPQILPVRLVVRDGGGTEVVQVR